MPEWDHEVDIVAVGSGVAGLTAALTAHAVGLAPMVLERGELVGGSSALAGGGLWVPANRWMLADGVDDSVEIAGRYLDAIVEDVGQCASPARRRAFLGTVNETIGFLEGLGVRFRRTAGYPDYYTDVPGSSGEGRGIESAVFDMSPLGEWMERLPKRAFPRNLPMGTLDVSRVVLARRTVAGFLTYMRLLAHFAAGKARRQNLTAGGGALVAQLLLQVVRRGIPIRTQTRAVELVFDGGRVSGVVAEGEGRTFRVAAKAGVLLGAGGFARNEEMRQSNLPHPTSAQWTSASPNDLGDGIVLGRSAGAATELMDDAWWGPSSVIPGGPAIFHVSERSKPGSLIVDERAERFMNEAQSYTDAVHRMYEGGAGIPAWLIFDSRYRSRYPFGALFPGRTPAELVENGYFKRADSLGLLAELCGLDAAALERTVERFNGFCRTGQDLDFGRGKTTYDRYYGDPRVKPNPCLGQLDDAPYYAVELVPGDLGTKGGLVTDEDGRVLRESGDPIEGLYAAGNTTASVMGRMYPGPGSTLAPAMTFSDRAVRHAAGEAFGQSPPR